MKQPLIELKGVSKVFPGVKALDSIDLEVRPGEIHGLIGENGAGKSTLIKILTGAYKNDAGKIFVEGKETVIQGPKHAMQLGINAIYQELNILPDLKVVDNIFIGREIKTKNKKGMLDVKKMTEKAKEVLEELGQEFDPKMNIGELGMGHQQMVEIAKSLCIDTKLLIMDEPTSSLSEREVRELMRTIQGLKEKGIAIIFISHRLPEIFEICDRVTVMRDGKKIKTLDVEELTEDELIKLMVGRSLEQQFPKIKTEIGEEVLRVENLKRNGVFENISFSLRKGEILGMAGLVGAGRTEVVRAIFGADPVDDGKVYIKGKEVKIKTPTDAMNNGIAFLTEDRKSQGLILGNTIDFNMAISCYKKFKKNALLNLKEMKKSAEDNIKKLKISPPNPSFMAGQLSGGNQQKVVIGKWLNTDADIFIFDEPTRGIDVGAKVEVYNIMNKLVSEGVAVIMISSELPEVIGMSDRVVVMSEGKLTAEINREDLSQENIMKAATASN
ncbi:sugar ABC transporter ATP-binding protein [Clostridium ganghwense]|uniref:Sugar ABC transporter ATP-binding protein n=2 Tax=Clostridium ganghwense TaxID=312089 RepID=A0ABT4CR37_9CLOT|nr:sugar ABC transporter ATP-binding protein [Clostridium ganghwense]MCY6371388.1 sugar ABC transporter ATP-binding protein [Clostridium ganghwense]